MPIRMLRDWTDSEKMNKLSVHAERFFVRLIMKVDDYGCFYANTALLKANCYPLLLDAVREADISRWMAECQKAGLIVIYEAGSKKYLQIKDFKQRLDKAKAKFPLPSENQLRGEFPEVGNEFPAETETETETEMKPNRAKALVIAGDDSQRKLRSAYDEIVKSLEGKERLDIWNTIREFISTNKPAFLEPYMDLWNVFAIKQHLIAEPQRITSDRRKKFATRIKESAFDFIKILEKIQASKFAKGDNSTGWKVTIEFILNSEENYTKILEGKYD